MINTYSEILKYIYSELGENVSVDQVVALMKNIDVKCKIKDSRIIFNYGITANFSDPVVQEARGIIMDMGEDSSNLFNWKIVCWPFRKFGNHYESYADDIDWETAQVQEKVDGSIVKCYYFDGEWHWATNGCIDAEDAYVNGVEKSFMDVIESADNFEYIDYTKLDKFRTYIFELVSPLNRVVVEYPIAHLYHIGTRSNLTGVEFNTDIGIQKPHVYKVSDPNIEKLVEEVERLNGDTCENEGFVVCDSNYHRVKVKNSQYLLLHHSLTSSVMPKESIVEAILFNDEEKINAILSYPRLVVQFKYYDWQVTKFLYEIDLYVKMARSLYESVHQNRKEFALKVSKDKYAMFAFKAIDYPYFDYKQLIELFGIKKILRFIEDYE